MLVYKGSRNYSVATSARERKEKGKEVAAQAVGKVMLEKPTHPDAICLTLGKI